MNPRFSISTPHSDIFLDVFPISYLHAKMTSLPKSKPDVSVSQCSFSALESGQCVTSKILQLHILSKLSLYYFMKENACRSTQVSNIVQNDIVQSQGGPFLMFLWQYWPYFFYKTGSSANRACHLLNGNRATGRVWFLYCQL